MLLEADVHVPLQRARRHLRVQGRPVRLRAVRLRGRHVHVAGCVRVGLRGDRGRTAHLLRARHRLRRQRRSAGHLHLEHPRRRHDLHRRSRLHASRGARSSRRRAARCSRTTATIDFIANVADATYECSLDLAPFTPCDPPVTYTGLTQGDHLLRVVATDLATGASELEAAELRVVGRRVRRHEPAGGHDRAGARRQHQLDDLRVRRHGRWRRRRRLLMFECRVDSTNELTGSSASARSTCSICSPTRTPRWRPASTRSRCGPGTSPSRSTRTPPLEGNVDPTPASHTWTMVADTTPPGTGILSGPPATVGVDQEIARFEFFGTDNATPLERSDVRVRHRRRGVRALHVARIPAAARGRPARLPRPRDRPGRQRRRDARHTHLDGRGRPGHDDHVRPRRADRRRRSAGHAEHDGERDLRLHRRPGRLHLRVLARRRRLRALHVAARLWVIETGTHEFEVRATNPEGVVEEPAAAYEWPVDVSDRTSRGPNTTITSAPTNPTASDVATFSFTGSDNRTLAANLRFECALDGTAFNSCVSPQQFSDLTHGTHTLLVRAGRRRRQLRPHAGQLQVDRRAAAGHDDPDRSGRGHHREHGRPPSPSRPNVPGSTFSAGWTA